MKKIQWTILLILSFIVFNTKAQDSSDYIEFNDAKNVVHGVYLGINMAYGEIDGKSTYLAGAKIAYVANRKFEIGVAGVGFYSDQNFTGPFENSDLVGGYGGFHIEPIFFGKSEFNLSIPILIGGGAVGHINEEWDEVIEFGGAEIENWDPFFVFEPGISGQYNISRYIQFEVSVKYRLTSSVDLIPGGIANVDGFSAGLGFKFGVFNLGRNKIR